MCDHQAKKSGKNQETLITQDTIAAGIGIDEFHYILHKASQPVKSSSKQS
jgi:hypothetical protein